MKIKKTKIPGIYSKYSKKKEYILTKNSTPGKTFFSEKEINGYRIFDPTHSKLAAAIAKKSKQLRLEQDSTILYLGAAHGYTVSFFSDILTKGIIYALEFAPTVIKDLIFLSEQRKNIIPILADVNKPQKYPEIIKKVDIIYQDIAQKNQAEILLKNLRFLKKEGYAFLAVKARSIDTLAPPSKIFKEVESILNKELNILEKIKLDPFEKDHCFYICKKQ